MENNIIHQITIDCLLNKDQKNKISHYSSSNLNGHIDYKTIQTNHSIKQEKKFYRRRILNLTKEMLLNNYSEDLLRDVKDSFNNYVKTCIGYFKIKDEMDILQNDYPPEINMNTILDEIANSNLDIDDIVSPEEADKLMMRSIKINKLPLDDFVTVKRTVSPKEIIIPKQKNINLKDPIFKKKGIIKKNNINKPYKDETENKK